ncbi:hypothetical protein [Paenibacillus sp. FSL L8-0709]|uniref:hypothetical protein n=1 Tax=Paenibacillus sp. FSL L8-0709 TaxID=2975312 RepID=UPI0030FAA9B6
MSLSADYQSKIKILNEHRASIVSRKSELTDAAYQIFSIDAQIRDQEKRMERFNLTFYTIHCSQCQGGIKEDEPHISIDSFHLCKNCIHTISMVKSSTEAEISRGLPKGTIKLDCKGPLQMFHKSNMVRKSGKFWLIHDQVLTMYYDSGRSTNGFELSWLDQMKKRLEHLKKQKDFHEQMRSVLPEDSFTQLHSAIAQISDLEARIARVESGKLPYRCSHCTNWIVDKDIPCLYGDYTICEHCIQTIGSVLTTSEAEHKYKLSPGSIRRDINREVLKRYLKRGLIWQSGNIWLLHEFVMKHHYLPRKKGTELAGNELQHET